MKKLSTVLAVFISILCNNIHAAAAGENAPACLGINLAAPADWNTELPFVDVFRLSRRWISQRAGSPWGQGPRLSLDKHGWVKRLQPGCYAEALMCWIDGGHYPSGNYTVLYDGEGRLQPAFAASLVAASPGRLIIRVDAAKGGFSLRLMSTNPADPLRNIRVIMPGFNKTYKAEPFHPVFLKRWRMVKTIRFMDWMQTNNSTVSRWDERPHIDDATFTVKGIPVEIMIKLCNRLQVNPWFCMPHRATDNYVRQFALLVKKELNPNLKIYIEYSNEVWNARFAQARYARQCGMKLKLHGNAWEKGGRYYAQRAVEIFKIWEQVFGGYQRLLRVIAWQAGGMWWLKHIIFPQNDSAAHADCLAIAPYISLIVPDRSKKLQENSVAGWSLDELFAYLNRQALPAAVNVIRNAGKTADAFHLQLIAYEGGQHLVGIGRAVNNLRLTVLFKKANRDPRMGAVYRKYFNAWQQLGGGLFCYFSSISRWNKWGCWGVMEYYDDNPKLNPKMQALLNWGQRLQTDSRRDF